MVQMTISVPRHLADKLTAHQSHIPEILEAGLAQFTGGEGTAVTVDVANFLASSPTPEQIESFMPSDKMKQRVTELLEKNRRGDLSRSENDELNEYGHLNQLMTLIKIEARRRLAQ